MLTDEVLAEKTLRGEIAAFEELVNRYKNSVFTIIYRMIGNHQEAEDISQEVFVTVYQKLYQFNLNRKFAPWIHRIAINTSISFLRKKNKVVVLNFDEKYVQRYEQEYNFNYYDPEVFLNRKELRDEIRSSLEKLPESYRAVLTLRYQLELNNQEIAETMGITKENVEVKIHRARKALRKVLIEKWEKEGSKGEMPALR